MVISKLLLLTTFLPLSVVSRGPHNDSSLLAGVLQAMLTSIFKPQGMTLTILTDKKNRFEADILNEVLNPERNIEIPILLNPNASTVLNNNKQARLFFIKNSEQLRKYLDTLRNYDIPGTQVNLVVLTGTKNSTDTEEESKNIFKYFFQFYILDINILTYNGNYIDIWTFFPYSSECCSCINAKLLYTYHSIPKTLKQTDIFPVKTSNLYQCPLSVVLWNVPPFMEIKRNHSGLQPINGYDASVLKELSIGLNFTIIPLPNEPPDFIGGTVYDNNSAEGVFKLLIAGNANMTLGCVSCKTKRFELTSASSSYFVLEYVVLLKTRLLFTTFDLLFIPFQAHTWDLIYTIFALRFLCPLIVNRKLRSRLKFRRFVLLFWLFFTFTLRSAYEGSMFKAICNPPYQPQPQIIDTLVKKNYSLLSDYATFRILSDIPALRNITHIIAGSPYDVLSLADDLPSNTGILTSSAFVATFMRNRLSHHSEYTLVREKLANGMNCIYFPKHSYLVPAVNNFLSKFTAYGLRHKFANEIGFENLPHTTDKWLNMHHTSTDSVLDIKFLKSVNRGLFYSYTLAFIVFLIENLYYALKRFICTKIIKNTR